MNFKEYIDRAMNYEKYESVLGEQLAMYRQHYCRFEMSREEEARVKGLKPLTLLVLTEPWCGDSLAIFPVLKKMAEVNGSWDIKILLRDENLDLIDMFLTRGGRAVPLFFFVAEDYSLILKWGPRPAVAQQIYEDHRAMIERGEIEKKEVIKKIRGFYSKDRGKAIIAELLGLL
jgi:hypothetical protein